MMIELKAISRCEMKDHLGGKNAAVESVKLPNIVA